MPIKRPRQLFSTQHSADKDRPARVDIGSCDSDVKQMIKYECHELVK